MSLAQLQPQLVNSTNSIGIDGMNMNMSLCQVLAKAHILETNQRWHLMWVFIQYDFPFNESRCGQRLLIYLKGTQDAQFLKVDNQDNDCRNSCFDNPFINNCCWNMCCHKISCNSYSYKYWCTIHSNHHCFKIEPNLLLRETIKNTTKGTG